MSTQMDAPIVAVTVFPGQARVTRRGTLALDAGEHRVQIGGLPVKLHADSVRVNGRGHGTVLGVDVTRERHARTPETTVAELERQRDVLRERLEGLSDQDTVLNAQADLLNSLARRSGSAFARNLARDEADVARVVSVSAALAAQLDTVLASRRGVSQTRRQVQAEHDQVERQIADRARHGVPDRRAIIAELAVVDVGDVELEVSYLVDDARWDSRYDIRLAADVLSLTWYGVVTQRTGEDWPVCDLRLSTARPASSITVPELSPWYLDVVRPLVTRASAERTAEDLYAGVPMPMAVSAAIPPPPMAAPEATAEHGVAATTYRPVRAVAVPPDGSAHRTTIAVVDLPAIVDHVTVPQRGPEAYLRATVTNTSEHTLRSGRAAIFHDSEYVGVTELATWAPGEEVELTLGIDDRVRVERELVHRSAGKAAIGGTRRREIRYRITVGNFGARPAHVTVIDQVPVSRHESVIVREVKLAPEPTERTELGEVTWRLDLDPGQTMEIDIAFRVDFAKGAQVSGWRD